MALYFRRLAGLFAGLLPHFADYSVLEFPPLPNSELTTKAGKWRQ